MSVSMSPNVKVAPGEKAWIAPIMPSNVLPIKGKPNNPLASPLVQTSNPTTMESNSACPYVIACIQTVEPNSRLETESCIAAKSPTKRMVSFGIVVKTYSVSSPILVLPSILSTKTIGAPIEPSPQSGPVAITVGAIA